MKDVFLAGLLFGVVLGFCLRQAMIDDGRAATHRAHRSNKPVDNNHK